MRSAYIPRTSLVSFFIVLFIASLFSILSFQNAYAQSNIGSSGLSLIANPEFPSPHSRVEVSIDDYSLDTTGASFTWYVNEIEQKEFRNARSIQIELSSLGKKTTVRMVATRSNAPSLSATRVFFPVKIDVLLEANTYVPYFYHGRALPTSQSKVRAVAVVHDGTSALDTSYSYKWSIGSTVVSGGAMRGKNTLDFDLPHYDNGGLRLDVYTADGELIGRQFVSLASVEPELHFYEYSPLRGLYRKEITSPFPLTGDEVTLYGEPYFIDATMDTNAADFAWTIGDTRTASDPKAPNAITLRRIGDAGDAQVGLSVVTKKRIPQFIEKSFQLFFE